ncbi:hypothetical protein [Streptomyces sp. NBC_00986]|uniref:hypothetical protein n=1 Tax=Streptomyces sp. NBC_00986 TaxID=2903702 RepID=UPI003868EA1B|nr:MBL fold metallo-hydrolase [Streptomyces sp. NBC_00986]
MPRTAVTRITHSCHLIEIGGRTFLTDPWFSTRPGYYQGEPTAIAIPTLSTGGPDSLVQLDELPID